MAPPLPTAGMGGLYQGWLHAGMGLTPGGPIERSSSLLDELASWPEADFDSQMMGTLRQFNEGLAAGAPAAASGLPGLPMVKERSGLSLSDLIKLRSTSDLNLSFTTGGSALRAKNFSEMSFGSYLENATGGDLNDLLPEF